MEKFGWGRGRVKSPPRNQPRGEAWGAPGMQVRKEKNTRIPALGRAYGMGVFIPYLVVPACLMPYADTGTGVAAPSSLRSAARSRRGKLSSVSDPICTLVKVFWLTHAFHDLMK